MPELRSFLVFDVESAGLHGEGFAVGWVAIEPKGMIFAEGIAVAPLFESEPWVEDNVIPNLPAPTHFDALGVRDEFWAAWMRWQRHGLLLAADVPWPVEARFLASCVDDEPESRAAAGPYPLIDIASVRLALGFDPLVTEQRLPNELPVHNPLADARQSARLLIEALTVRQHA